MHVRKFGIDRKGKENMKKRFISTIAILLVLATILTSCAPALNNLSEPKDTQTGTSNVADTDITTVTNLSYGAYRDSYKINVIDSDTSGTEYETETDLYSFVISCIAFDIAQFGYTVCEGVATDAQGNSYMGLVFADGKSTYSDGENEMQSAGFLQLIDEHTEILLTEDTIKNGVVAVVGEDETYLVNQYVQLNPFSGIFNGYYFKYCQASPYVMTVSTTPVDSHTAYDYGVDCYDFDAMRTKWKADPSVRPTLEAYSLYSDEVKAYLAVCDAIDQLIALQEQNAYRGQKTVLMVIDPAVLDALAMNETPELLNDYAMEALRGVEVEENQFLVISATDGVQIYTLPDVQEMVAQRRSNGWMQILTSTLMLAGSVVIAACSFGAGTPLVVTSIAVVAGTVASVYAVSNLIEGIDNVRLANCGDIYSPAMNPVRNRFVEEFGDKGVTIYNAVGLGSMFIQSLTMPIGAGFKLANAVGAGIGQTTVILIRATAVYLCELAITTAASVAATKITSYLVEKWTDNNIAADWSGLVAGFATGFATMKGLNAIDKRWNFSGLYTKQDVLQKYYIENQEKALNKFKPETWEKLSESAQKSAIKRASKFIAKDIGLGDKVPKIKYYNDPSDDAGYGFFRESDYSININKAYWNDSTELVDTIAHELTHAYQSQLVKSGITNDVTRSYLNYITPEEDWTAYRRQACEDQAFRNGEAWRNIANNLEGKSLDWSNSTRKDGLSTMEHIMREHTSIRSGKADQGVFHVSDENSLRSVIEDAWMRRGTPIVEGPNLVYNIPMEDVGSIYANGQYVGVANSIRIVVLGDNLLISAYPIF